MARFEVSIRIEELDDQQKRISYFIRKSFPATIVNTIKEKDIPTYVWQFAISDFQYGSFAERAHRLVNEIWQLTGKRNHVAIIVNEILPRQVFSYVWTMTDQEKEEKERQEHQDTLRRAKEWACKINTELQRLQKDKLGGALLVKEVDSHNAHIVITDQSETAYVSPADARLLHKRLAEIKESIPALGYEKCWEIVEGLGS